MLSSSGPQHRAGLATGSGVFVRDSLFSSTSKHASSNTAAPQSVWTLETHLKMYDCDYVRSNSNFTEGQKLSLASHVCKYCLVFIFYYLCVHYLNNYIFIHAVFSMTTIASVVIIN